MNTAEPEISQPIKPRWLRVSFDQAGDELRIGFRRRNWFAGGFMLVWLIGWTVGCVALAGVVLEKPGVFMLLFAVPFWASWLLVFFALLWTLFLFEELTFDRGGVQYQRHVLVPLASRTVPLGEVKGFEPYTTVVDSENGRCESGIEIATLGHSIRCLQGLGQDELDWLQATLQGHLAELAGEVAPARSRELVSRSAVPAARRMPDDVSTETLSTETLSAGHAVTAPPSDCCWSRDDGFRDICFVKRGRLAWGSIAGLTFMNLFWNGVVGVFVALLCGLMPDINNPPQGSAWWFMFFFLIPFEAIGLAIFLGLVAAVLEPVHWIFWTFSDDQIELRHAWFGIGRRWTWPVRTLSQIQLRREPSVRTGRRQVATQDSAGVDCRLVFVDREAGELCSLANLTEGEARWIGQIVLGERSAWFR